LIGPLVTHDSITVVEFRDDGYAVDRQQVAAALEHIDNVRERTRAQRPLLVLTYTHGWHHGADTGGGGDFQRFRELIRQLRGDSTKWGGGVPEIVPIYLAWRGSSLPIPVVKFATFWSRKAAAERVGRGEYAALIAEVAERRLRWQMQDSIAPMSPPALVVHTGHSFGGAALLSATLPLLASSIAAQSEFQPQPADLVVALNPAIEAAVLGQTVLSPIVATADAMKARAFVAKRALVLAMASKMGPEDPHAPTRLAIIDARSDFPRKVLFPFGQGLDKGVSGLLLDGVMIGALLAPWHAVVSPLAVVPGVRLLNRLPFAPMDDDERTAAGRYEPQVRLAASVASTAPGGASCWSMTLGSSRKLVLSPRVPADTLACERGVKVIRVPDEIIDGHSDIWRAESVALINALVRGSLQAAYDQRKLRLR
jgi:hypothetical protein